jgi:hypothetical protein
MSASPIARQRAPMSASRRSRIALRGLGAGAAIGTVAAIALDAGHTALGYILGGATLGWVLGGCGALVLGVWRARHR